MVTVDGTITLMSASAAILPPLLPVKAIVVMRSSLASSSALMQLRELPEVEMARSTSPSSPSASTWREKTLSKLWSLPTAVRIEVSVVRAMARSAGRSTVNRTTNSATMCCESAGAAAVSADEELAAVLHGGGGDASGFEE